MLILTIFIEMLNVERVTSSSVTKKQVMELNKHEPYKTQ